MTKNRVVVTGLGVVSPVGNDVSTMWDHLISGHVGIGELSSVNADDFPTKIAAEVKDFDPKKYMEKKTHAKWTYSPSSLSLRQKWH